ncbi:PLDc N-terminal domain-containing protein [Jiangella endophytica]|uniref:PLDc N-terminal domain-containing protein n=1 Tax=Jiangella endophytica TaxID=1623398 RepID=UPI000E346EAD|nr:PLDc N-terminal domain-containing protein [Jiangella endophytica]
MTSTRRWSDLTTAQRTAIVALGTAELVLTALAAADLARRPSTQVRGPKALWWPALAVQPTGPIAYLVWGRRG